MRNAYRYILIVLFVLITGFQLKPVERQQYKHYTTTTTTTTTLPSFPYWIWGDIGMYRTMIPFGYTIQFDQPQNWVSKMFEAN